MQQGFRNPIADPSQAFQNNSDPRDYQPRMSKFGQAINYKPLKEFNPSDYDQDIWKPVGKWINDTVVSPVANWTKQAVADTKNAVANTATDAATWAINDTKATHKGIEDNVAMGTDTYKKILNDKFGQDNVNNVWETTNASNMYDEVKKSYNENHNLNKYDVAKESARDAIDTNVRNNACTVM